MNGDASRALHSERPAKAHFGPPAKTVSSPVAVPQPPDPVDDQSSHQEIAMTALTLAKATQIIAAAFAKGADLKFKPLGVSVLDAGGHLVAFQRQDGASFLRPQMSAGKAYGALAVGMGSRRVEAFARERPHLVAGISDVSGSRILPVVGGVLVRDHEGAIVGAVGISGDTSDNDEAAAIAGIEAAGFTADPG
jgi:uncharacterized protein GlcG (DUF336 family)